MEAEGLPAWRGERAAGQEAVLWELREAQLVRAEPVRAGGEVRGEAEAQPQQGFGAKRGILSVCCVWGPPGSCPPGQEANLIGGVGGDGNQQDVSDTESQACWISAVWELPAGVHTLGKKCLLWHKGGETSNPGFDLRPGFRLLVPSQVIPAQPPSALPAPLWTAVCTAGERLGGPTSLKTAPRVWSVDSIASLAFCQSGASKPVLSSKPCAFWLLRMFAGGFPPPGASLHWTRFLDCPAGGTNPLNEGCGLAAEILQLRKGSQQVPRAASLITHQAFHLTFSSLRFFGQIPGSLQSCVVVLNSEFYCLERKLLEMIV